MNGPEESAITTVIKRIPFVSLLLAGGAAAVELWPGASTALQLDRAALAGGEWWRVFTCHFTHFGTNHLIWDLLVFLVLGSICEWIDRRSSILAILISLIAIPIAVIGFLPSITSYRGLSGIDSALFALLATDVIAENVRSGQRIWTIVSFVLPVSFLIKIAIEIWFSVNVFADNIAGGYVPVPLAHLVGLTAGGLAQVLRRTITLKQSIYTAAEVIC